MSCQRSDLRKTLKYSQSWTPCLIFEYPTVKVRCHPCGYHKLSWVPIGLQGNLGHYHIETACFSSQMPFLMPNQLCSVLNHTLYYFFFSCFVFNVVIGVCCGCWASMIQMLTTALVCKLYALCTVIQLVSYFKFIFVDFYRELYCCTSAYHLLLII